MPRVTCDLCGEVIGVYEPMVIVAQGQRRETSRAAEENAAEGPGERYHRSCYERAAEHRAAGRAATGRPG